MSSLVSQLFNYFKPIFGEDQKTVNSAQVEEIGAKIYDKSYQQLCQDNDKVFAGILVLQWALAVAFAVFWSPYTWIGSRFELHIHVYAAFIGGALLTLYPLWLNWYNPGGVLNRYVNVSAQGLFSALLIHLSGGRIETHFHVFGSLAFFAFYRDIKVLLVGTVIVAADHALRGIFLPQSVYGMDDPSRLRWMEHAAWVVFEDFFLAYACYRGREEMRIVALNQAQVLVINENIEKTVKLRTQELSESRENVKQLLDNAGEGFFSFDVKGFVGPEYSKVVTKLLGYDPAKKKVSQILKDPKTDWDFLIPAIFNESIPFGDLVVLLPAEVQQNNYIIKVRYTAIRNQAKQVASVMVIMEDVTQIRKLETDKERESYKNQALIKIIAAKNDFYELLELVKELKAAKAPQAECVRTLHTIKGGFAFLDLRDVAEECHHLETELKDKYTSQKLSAGAAKIEKMLTAFVEENNKVLNLKNTKPVISVESESLENIIYQANQQKANAQVIKSLEQLAEQPISECFSRLSDVFVNTCEKLGKKAQPIHFDAASVPIRPELYRPLIRSLIHVVRNSADHGIEYPDDRAMLGKSAEGNMSISLKEEGDQYILTIKDDGHGVDLEEVRKKANAMGISVPADEQKALSLILKEGFSTKAEVTETSGRGVGLDAVESEIKKLGGSVSIQNKNGEGLQISMTFAKLKHMQNAGNASNLKLSA